MLELSVDRGRDPVTTGQNKDRARLGKRGDTAAATGTAKCVALEQRAGCARNT